ncbi:uncharacterized protein LOC107802915 isoform X2 [Nicotiana tabacum]|uniref:Uncharacterized protein LOC107802915 isoform X2 n=2 Tax=Nicotiana TaxID=4085 RepID=A0AC58UJ52_TOBAC|nr:PREDICTED: uncharacterized protein LOC104243309 isoform X2 [Nicotiana sylvestris]
MKRSIEGFNQLNAVDEEAKAKLKQKHLLNEFLELQKEFVSKKRKLQAAKQRRDIILGEILERDIPHMKNFDTESEVPKEERFNSGYDAAGETARPAFTSKFNSGYEVGDDEALAGRDVLRLEFLPKNYLIDDSGVGKKKLSWHGEVTFKV